MPETDIHEVFSYLTISIYFFQKRKISQTVLWNLEYSELKGLAYIKIFLAPVKYLLLPLQAIVHHEKFITIDEINICL